MNIKKIKHGPKGNRFCGPGALSAITGRQTDATAKMLRKLTGRRQITGCHDFEMRRAFKAFGYEMTQTFGYTYLQKTTRGFKEITLAKWLQITPRPAGKVFLVSAGNHYQVISGRRFVCSQTVDIVSVRDKRVHRRARVKAAWEITKVVPVVDGQHRRAA